MKYFSKYSPLLADESLAISAYMENHDASRLIALNASDVDKTPAFMLFVSDIFSGELKRTGKPRRAYREMKGFYCYAEVRMLINSGIKPAEAVSMVADRCPSLTEEAVEKAYKRYKSKDT